jgi:hypothetical protein
MRYTAEALTKLRAPSSARGIMACGERRSHRAKPARKTPPVMRGTATSHDPQGWDADSVSPRVTDTSPSARGPAGRAAERDTRPCGRRTPAQRDGGVPDRRHDHDPLHLPTRAGQVHSRCCLRGRVRQLAPAGDQRTCPLLRRRPGHTVPVTRSRSHCPGVPQRGDLRGGEAELGQDLVGVLADRGDIAKRGSRAATDTDRRG